MRNSIIVSLLIVAVMSAGIASAGSVRIDFDPAVGWVNLNTTASGRLIATAHVQDGLPDEAFSVSIRVRYEDQSTDVFADIATLTTNGQGKGNVQVQVDLNPPPGSSTLRRVAVRVRRAPDPLYLAVAWDLPLK
jgi:hypothetical protein